MVQAWEPVIMSCIAIHIEQTNFLSKIAWELSNNVMFGFVGNNHYKTKICVLFERI